MLIRLIDNKPDGFPVVEENFRQLFPNTSFPALLTPEAVEGTGFGMYEFSYAPQAARYEKAVEVTPVKDDSGVWRQTWEVVPLNEEEKAEVDERKSAEVRAQRNRRLTDCDWTQLGDAPVNAADWAAYRQALRDITEQEGFPWAVSWPEQPA